MAIIVISAFFGPELALYLLVSPQHTAILVFLLKILGVFMIALPLEAIVCIWIKIYEHKKKQRRGDTELDSELQI